MDKSKALNVLLKMKFMQRKEEAKRRALYESQQYDEIEDRLHERTTVVNGEFPSSSSAHFATLQEPIILDNSSFPRSGYQYARRLFTTNTETISKRLAEESHNISNDNIERCTSREKSESSIEAYNIWDEVENDPSAISIDSTGPKKCSVRNDTLDSVKNPESEAKHTTQSRGNIETKRFHPPNAINAPKLPKRLAEEMTRQKGTKRRRKDNPGA
ncbi:unnamed protein product [Phytomonas sp. Hart1]|nr:unnamed protein product [Phytomonas sp. Hart1]|eukprot:CCW66073.1 unnamed protein product [Phytomonas sp. isolate Hart1]